MTSDYLLLCCLIIPSSVLAGMTPDCRQTDFPSLKRINVGTERIWNFSAKDRFLSTSILMILALVPTLFLTCSRIGFNCLQGPHHSAEKSTSTGSVDFNNSANLLIMSVFSSQCSVVRSPKSEVRRTLSR